MKHLWKYLLPVFLLTGCVLVDEDMSDCDTDYTLDYELRLVTNMTTELQTQLSMAADVSVSAALKATMKDIFTDYAHDVNLSFYDVYSDSSRLHNERHIMDGSQSSYTLYIPVRKYMHLAIANIEDNREVVLEADDRCHTSRLTQPVRDTIDSHSTGIFTARLPMDVKEGEDQQFNVRLYMANCASALVLDTLGSGIRDIRVYASGFATGYSIADSTYRFDYTPIVRARKVPVEGTEPPLCFTTVTFPSRDVPSSKTTIESPDEFVSEAAENPLWRYKIYTTLKDGTVTETVLGVKLPLMAGQMKVVKASIIDDGSCVPVAPWVGSLVTLDWIEQPGWEVDF
ncbi:MAG: hypothetical protein IK052_03980 [Bacteroidales bacterium]|nr:hypothetical protein [Bacteroidales bacterium]